jgi:glycosyltransferase involved in cell wall biosynthesis
LSIRVREIRIGGEVAVSFGAAALPRRSAGAGEIAPPGINILGYVRDLSGVGESARLCAAAAQAAGLRSSLVDFRDALVEGGLESRGFVPSLPVNVIHANADQVPLVASVLGDRYLRGRYNVGVWHWELPELPDQWLASFEPLDEIWAPSRFILDALAAKSPRPVVHMPHGVQVPLTNADRREFDLPADTVAILMMYDMRSLQERKNPLGAIDAFARVGGDGRRASLVVKVMNGGWDAAALAAVHARSREVPGVIVIDEVMDVDRVRRLQASCDVFLSLHRSEGFGLNIAESMCLGKPVVVTGWSGNMDFTDERNACLVGYGMTVVGERVGPYPPGGRWADPDLDHAAWHLRRLIDDESLRRTLGQAARQHMELHHSPAAAGERMRKRLGIVGRIRVPHR